jgi:hypothetical protein
MVIVTKTNDRINQKVTIQSSGGQTAEKMRRCNSLSWKIFVFFSEMRKNLGFMLRKYYVAPKKIAPSSPMLAASGHHWFRRIFNSKSVSKIDSFIQIYKLYKMILFWRRSRSHTQPVDKKNESIWYQIVLCEIFFIYSKMTFLPYVTRNMLLLLNSINFHDLVKKTCFAQNSIWSERDYTLEGYQYSS